MDYTGVKLMLQGMSTNVSEASEKIRMAFGFRKDWRALADWLREMAVAHLNFNQNGMKAVQSCMNAMRSDPAHDDLSEGRLQAYDEWLDQIVADTADVQAMISSYGKV